MNLIKIPWCILSLTVIFHFGCEKDSVDEMSEIPELRTSPVSQISDSSAISGGSMLTNNGQEITDKGICWSSQMNPTKNDEVISAGPGSGSFTVTISGLQPSSSYFVRAYATNSIGTGYGEEIRFWTLGTPVKTVQDIDGNAYTVIEIGDQAWMGRNLQVTKFRNGTDIPLITEDSRWEDLSTPVYSYYNNNSGNMYGPLYNGFTILKDEVCPEGWHLPTKSEWATLFESVGGKDIAGGKLKARGTIHWAMPNVGAADDFGFTALPGGLRYLDGSFRNEGSIGYWWASPEDSSMSFPSVAMVNDRENADEGGTEPNFGLSIRCIQD